jgi:hypothetical protein
MMYISFSLRINLPLRIPGDPRNDQRRLCPEQGNAQFIVTLNPKDFWDFDSGQAQSHLIGSVTKSLTERNFRYSVSILIGALPSTAIRSRLA